MDDGQESRIAARHDDLEPHRMHGALRRGGQDDADPKPAGMSWGGALMLGARQDDDGAEQLMPLVEELAECGRRVQDYAENVRAWIADHDRLRAENERMRVELSSTEHALADALEAQVAEGRVGLRAENERLRRDVGEWKEISREWEDKTDALRRRIAELEEALRDSRQYVESYTSSRDVGEFARKVLAKIDRVLAENEGDT